MRKLKVSRLIEAIFQLPSNSMSTQVPILWRRTLLTCFGKNNQMLLQWTLKKKVSKKKEDPT